MKNSLSKQIAERIKEYRKSVGLTQQELAEKMDVARQTITEVENASREVKAWELAKIAKVLKVNLLDLMDSNYEKSNKHEFILWRSKPENPCEVENKFKKLCCDYKFLEEILKIDKFGKLPSCSVDLLSFNFHEAYSLAESVREQIGGLGNFPALSLKNVLEEKYGVKFFFIDLGSTTGSAATLKSENDYCILINSQEPQWRQDFSIAHELFHLVTWEDGLLKSIKNNKELFDKNEKLANAFAAGLLLPREILAKEVNNYLDKDDLIDSSSLVVIARKFKVSFETLLYRMSNLNMFSEKTVTKLLEDNEVKNIDKISWREQNLADYEYSSRFVNLAYLAYQKGKISKGRFADMFDIQLSDTSNFFNHYGLGEITYNEAKVNYT